MKRRKTILILTYCFAVTGGFHEAARRHDQIMKLNVLSLERG